MAYLHGSFLDCYVVGTTGARGFEPLSRHRRNRRHEDRTRTVAILRSHDSRAIGNGFLSLTLKDSTNRWANVIMGVVYVGLQLFALVETLTLQTVYAYAVLMEGTKAIVHALIVWHSWKSKQKA